MAVSENYRAFVVEQLARVLPEVRDRRMFGGVGIYTSTTFFAVIGDDVLYFKVDDTTRPAYIARQMQPFRPFGEGGEALPYYEVPPDVLEDLDALRAWAEQSVSVARRIKQSKARKAAPRPRKKP